MGVGLDEGDFTRRVARDSVQSHCCGLGVVHPRKNLY